MDGIAIIFVTKIKVAFSNHLKSNIDSECTALGSYIVDSILTADKLMLPGIAGISKLENPHSTIILLGEIILMSKKLYGWKSAMNEATLLT